MKVNYIKGRELSEYILEEKKAIFKQHNKTGRALDKYLRETGKHLIERMIHTYVHLLKGLMKLEKAELVHYDLKTENIILDDERKIPIIIDFGLSIDVKDLMISLTNIKAIKDLFYVYAPEYHVWCSEIMFLSFLYNVLLAGGAEEARGTGRAGGDGGRDMDEASSSLKLSREDVSRFSREVVSKNPVFQKLFNENVREEYKKVIYDYYVFFVGLSLREIQEKLLKPKYIYTWDKYSLAMIYLRIIYYLYNGQMERIQGDEFMYSFSRYLLSQVHPNPEKRMSNRESMKELIRMVRGMGDVDGMGGMSGMGGLGLSDVGVKLDDYRKNVNDIRDKKRVDDKRMRETAMKIRGRG
jgi:serine/threonine protein kinase